MENKAPLPAPKPWIRTAGEIMNQAQQMMTPPIDTEPTPSEEDPE